MTHLGRRQAEEDFRRENEETLGEPGDSEGRRAPARAATPEPSGNADSPPGSPSVPAPAAPARPGPPPRIAPRAPVRGAEGHPAVRQVFRTASGRTLPEPAGKLRTLLVGFDDGDLSLGLFPQGDGRPGPVLARVQLSRAAKVLRVAEAMARLADKDWRELPLESRRRWATLAERAVEAVELVEHDEQALARNPGRW